MERVRYTALTLDSGRSICEGTESTLLSAIRRGADPYVGTQFRHNEHIDTRSDNPEVIREVMNFPVTYLLENRWVAGIMTVRQPVELPHGFGRRPGMSFFLYNQDGQQAIARLFLDGGPIEPMPYDHSDMPKYHLQSHLDTDTNAPSSNFIYDFDEFRYIVRDDWQEVFSHDAGGSMIGGSLAHLVEAFRDGCDIKVGVRGLCADLTQDTERALDHEVLVRVHSCYYYTERKLFLAGTHPVVRVRTAVPLVYQSRGWDFGWLLTRSDGHVAYMLCDPFTLRFRRSQARHALRWFVR